MPPLLYPFTLGMLAAVNPCGFPLLPAYLEFFVGRRGEGEPVPARAVRAVAAAAVATCGFLVLFAALGTVTQLGWSEVTDRFYSDARYVMVAMGAAMVVVGTAFAAGRPLRLKLPQVTPGLGRRRRPVALALFGLSYGVASIGCALPLFVTGVAASFSRTSTLGGIAGFCAYGLGMGFILCALALALSILGTGTTRALRRVSRWVPVAGGVLLVATGVYITWYWVNEITSPARSFALERWVTAVQQHVSSTLDAHASLAGGVVGALVVITVLAGALRPRRSGQGTGQPDASPGSAPHHGPAHRITEGA